MGRIGLDYFAREVSCQAHYYLLFLISSSSLHTPYSFVLGSSIVRLFLLLTSLVSFNYTFVSTPFADSSGAGQRGITRLSLDCRPICVEISSSRSNKYEFIDCICAVQKDSKSIPENAPSYSSSHPRLGRDRFSLHEWLACTCLHLQSNTRRSSKELR